MSNDHRSLSTPDGASIDECVAFIRELMDNAQTIADTKNGDDRAGWLDDARLHAAVLSFLARSETPRTWIPVSERMPEKSEAAYVDSEDDCWLGYVIGFAPEHRRRKVGLAMAYKDTGHSVLMDGLTCSHWMPLPEGPK